MNIVSRIGRVLLAGTAAVFLFDPAAITQGKGNPGLVRPASAASIQISFFYDRLSPHGSWVKHRRYGHVFVPAVGTGWRPYTHGHWVYTDRYGWYWESDEPFAWAVYHYGRWAYDPVYGWVWVPGNVWGPAWVTWRHGGGHVGWAPIGPHDRGYVYGTPDYYEPAVVEAWVFVPERRFVAVDIASYVAPVVEINLFLNKSRERHHVQYSDGRAYNPFLPRERVTKIVNKEINVYNITNVNDPKEAEKRSAKSDEKTIKSFQADIAGTEPKEKPKKVAKTPDEVKSKPKLKETAKGEKPDDAPPSAAELKPDGDEDTKKPRQAKEDGKPGKDGKTAKGESKPDDKAEGKEKAEGKSEDKPDSDGKAKAEDEGGAKADAKAKAGGDGEAKADGKVKADAKAEAEGNAKDKVKGKAAARAKGKSKAKADAEAKAKSDKPQKQQATPKAEPKKKPKANKAGVKPKQQKQPKQATPKGNAKPQKESRAKSPARPKGNAQRAKQAKPKAPRAAQRQAPKPKAAAPKGQAGRAGPHKAAKQGGGGAPGGQAKGPAGPNRAN